ncbi:MAG TPA: IS1595 family transposase [Bryobacteraceae bacterium]|nr:IS1595 family transposase [Bryobacteraceae bacterium]
MNKWPETLQEAIVFFSNPENCDQFMIAIRWQDGKVRCPHCDSDKVTYLAKQRRWKCYGKHPKSQFSLKVGTIFEDSPLGLEKWLPAAWLICNCKNGISSYELARDLKITQKSTWFMLHRIRLAMQSGTFKKLAGPIEADETFIGGKVRNMHLDKQTRARMGKKRIGGFEGKAVVMGLLDRNTREARVKVTPNNRAFYARTNVIENVEKGAAVYSDSLRSYRNLPVDGFAHEFIDHTEAYVRGHVHTNGLENFWSLFKRALKGTYVSVEPFHLQAYADEQCFRFNERKSTDFDRFALVMMQVVGRRITYDELTGKTERQPG